LTKYFKSVLPHAAHERPVGSGLFVTKADRRIAMAVRIRVQKARSGSGACSSSSVMPFVARAEKRTEAEKGRHAGFEDLTFLLKINRGIRSRMHHLEK